MTTHFRNNYPGRSQGTLCSYLIFTDIDIRLSRYVLEACDYKCVTIFRESMELLHTTSCFNAEALNKHFIQHCTLIESGGVWACYHIVWYKQEALLGAHTHAVPSPPTLQPLHLPTPPNSLHSLHTH